MRIFRWEQGYRQLGHQPAELFRIGSGHAVRASGRPGQVKTAAVTIDTGDDQPAAGIGRFRGLGRARTQSIGLFYVCKIERNHYLAFARVFVLGVGRQI